jgi:flagellar biosynthetic protein FlhB
MAEDDSNKEHAATGRQREKYAEEGDVARSKDLSAALGFAASMTLLMAYSGSSVSRLSTGFQMVLRSVGQPADQRLFHRMLNLFWQTTTPFFCVSIGVAVGLAFWQNGYTIPFRAPKFDLSFLNFLPKLLQTFQLKESGLNLAVQAFKMVILGWVCGRVMLDKVPQMVQHVPASLRDGTLVGGDLLGTLVRRAAITYLIMGAFDFWLNHYRLEERMKMSTQQIRDEAKDINGDTRTKGRMRALHAKLIQQRSMQDVPKADVILVNPTHYAVAIVYNDAQMEAPTVVAKGVDLWADRIRSIARSNGVPIISQPSLARALYAKVETGKTIPQELFQAVALVLAHVYRIRKRNS